MMTIYQNHTYLNIWNQFKMGKSMINTLHAVNNNYCVLTSLPFWVVLPVVIDIYMCVTLLSLWFYDFKRVFRVIDNVCTLCKNMSCETWEIVLFESNVLFFNKFVHRSPWYFPCVKYSFVHLSRNASLVSLIIYSLVCNLHLSTLSANLIWKLLYNHDII